MYLDFFISNSFKSLWYWFLVIGVWALVFYRTYGIPDKIMRLAKFGNKDCIKKSMQLFDIYTKYTFIDCKETGIYLIAIISFIMVSIATIGFVNGTVAFQAIFFVLFPLSVLWGVGTYIFNHSFDQNVEWEKIQRAYTKFYRIKLLTCFISILASLIWTVYLEISPYLWVLNS